MVGSAARSRPRYNTPAHQSQRPNIATQVHALIVHQISQHTAASRCLLDFNEDALLVELAVVVVVVVAAAAAILS
jgi:uncharacterized membrane protein